MQHCGREEDIRSGVQAGMQSLVQEVQLRVGQFDPLRLQAEHQQCQRRLRNQLKVGRLRDDLGEPRAEVDALALAMLDPFSDSRFLDAS